MVLNRLQYIVGIVNDKGPTWRKSRKLCMRALRDLGPGGRSTEDKLLEECRLVMQKMESIDFLPQEILMKFTSNIIGLIVFGQV